MIELDHKTFLDISEASEFLRIPESTFRKLVAQRYRKIPFTKLGKRIVFKRDLLEKWMEDMILSEVDL